MTPEQARTVANAVANIDGGCIFCVAEMGGVMLATFPEHDWATMVAEGKPDSVYSREEIAQSVRDGAARPRHIEVDADGISVVMD